MLYMSDAELRIALAQSFPDSYKVVGNKRQQVKQWGNAVACKVAKALGEVAVEMLS